MPVGFIPSLVQWLLEEGGAKITDTIVMRGESLTLWIDIS
jgi:hypothetical protein